MTKRDVGWLFACLFLGLALFVSVILGVTGYFSSVAYLKSQTDLTVGDSLVIACEANGTAVMSCTFDGAYLSGERLSQVVQISSLQNDVDLKVRVKSVVSGNDDNFSFVTSEHFTLDEDGCYYYDDVLASGTKITFCTALVIPSDASFVSGERYVLTFVVEALEEQYAASVWGV